jgi:transposase
LAKEMGVSFMTVHRIWRKYGLQPHRVETFKFSTDPEFDSKLADIVGLYLDPPERALVLCVDEKSQIQALDRTQPLLPLRPGIPAQMTHDYERHGTTSLFAALEVASGEVHGRCFRRHRHREFIAFLESLAKRYPRVELHLICDNYGTHKHPKVRAWLEDHPRFHLHFTPTSASWLNLVERWFGIISQQAIRRGSFTSVAQLERPSLASSPTGTRTPSPSSGPRPPVKSNAASKMLNLFLLRDTTSSGAYLIATSKRPSSRPCSAAKKTMTSLNTSRSPRGRQLQIRAAQSQRWYQQWLKSAITMMMGIGTPSRKSKIERIVKPPQFV